MYESYGMETGTDQVKEMITDTDPILFGVTMLVSMLHSIFEILAVKNEIQFWKNVKTHKGLSLRTLNYR